MAKSIEPSLGVFLGVQISAAILWKLLCVSGVQ